MMHSISRAALTVLLASGLGLVTVPRALAGQAYSSVTESDVQRLQDGELAGRQPVIAQMGRGLVKRRLGGALQLDVGV